MLNKIMNLKYFLLIYFFIFLIFKEFFIYILISLLFFILIFFQNTKTEKIVFLLTYIFIIIFSIIPKISFYNDFYDNNEIKEGYFLVSNSINLPKEQDPLNSMNNYILYDKVDNIKGVFHCSIYVVKCSQDIDKNSLVYIRYFEVEGRRYIYDIRKGDGDVIFYYNNYFSEIGFYFNVYLFFIVFSIFLIVFSNFNFFKKENKLCQLN